MFKEWAQRRVDEVVLRSVQFGKNRGLKKEGKLHFDQLIEDYKQGRQILLSRYIHVLDGSDYESNINGVENLDAIKDQAALFVANHPYQDPLRGGHCQRILINHYVNQATQKEIRWLHGLDKTTIEQFTRNRFAKQSNTIPVRDDDPETAGRLIKQAFRNNDAIGINPEGDGNTTLLRGLPKAGQMILLSVINNYNIVCVTTDFRNDSFFLTFGLPLDNEKLKKAKNISQDRDLLRQTISDYAMAMIAMHLPEEKRGYYSNFQKFIDTFEYLITPN